MTSLNDIVLNMRFLEGVCARDKRTETADLRFNSVFFWRHCGSTTTGRACGGFLDLYGTNAKKSDLLRGIRERIVTASQDLKLVCRRKVLY
ncbi:unnamed protein product [Protopolystoma xenopodis]|uniref:Uncharacterized protein n=1 Tax=Protopolystoma xenopodis TaxID=117903 RepID=A0A448WB94_9PLAT|nr:unnamed protein product [Protopolystoma xenopodis]